jgi:Spy/CpxP family protein refolding chaperone
MRRISWAMASFVAAVAFVSSSALVTLAADEKAPADKPAATEKAGKKAKAKTVRLVKPWSDMTSLSDDQKTKINDLHKKALAEIKEVKQREVDAILAVLNEEQKAEYSKLVAKDTTDKKMKKSGASGDTGAAAPAATEKKSEKAG